MIAKDLGTTPLQAEFSYCDVIKNLWLLFLAGGDCAEDIQERLKSNLLQTHNVNVCSPDTIDRVLKSLATPNTVYTSDAGMEHQFSNHVKLNALNLDMKTVARG